MKSSVLIKDIRTFVLGLAFITATTTAIIGLLHYQPVFDTNLSTEVLAASAADIRTGAFYEMLLMTANIGTAVLLFPFLTTTNRSWGMAYAAFRLMEVVFIGMGAAAMLVLSSELMTAGSAQPSDLTPVVRSLYKWTMIAGPHFMLGINTFIYSTHMYRERMIPRGIALLGMTGAGLIFGNAVTEIFGLRDVFSVATMINAFPIAIFEMILAVWIIIKGLHVPAVRSIESQARIATA